MGYIEDNLKKDEKIITTAKINKLAILSYLPAMILEVIIGIAIQILTPWMVEFTFGRIFLGIIVPILFYVSAPISFVVKTVKLLTSQLVVTDMRIISKKGLFSTSIVEFPIQRVDSVVLNTGFFGKIFHYYKIDSKTAGVGNDFTYGVDIDAVTNANEIKGIITSSLERHEDQARKAQAEYIANAMNQPTETDEPN